MDNYPMVQRCKDRAVRWMFWRVALGELFNVTVSCSDYMFVIGERTGFGASGWNDADKSNIKQSEKNLSQCHK